MNVYLSGMIGSGKTVIGERLADRLGRPFLDLDREMDRELGRSFHDLVREEGWLAFREREYAMCRRFAKLQRVVVALGGGTVRLPMAPPVRYKSGRCSRPRAVR